MDLGSILTSSASGSCSRRAIDTAPRIETSRSGSSPEAYADAEYTDAPASDTTTLISPGQRAVPDRDQLHPMRLHQGLERDQRLFPAVRRLVRVDGVKRDDLTGGVDDGDLDPGAEPRVQAQRRAGAGRCGQQQVLEVGREHRGGVPFRGL